MRSASIFRERLTRAAAALAVALSAAIAGAQSAPPVFRSGTDLVVLQVAVTDAQRRYVPGLQADNFTVFDEGVPQPVAMFATADSPLDVLLLMDTSGSMDLRLPVAKRAAADLVSTLRSGDRAGLILFEIGAWVAHPLSERHDSVIEAVRGISSGGATALYESVYLALHTLSRLRRTEGGVRRQALVILTDGTDNASRVPFEQALDAAQAGDVTIFTILPGAPAVGVPLEPDPRWQDATTRFEMRRLAEDTGGRAFVTTDPAGLAGVYEQIGSELRAQYWLAYAPPAGAPGFRRVSVRVHAPGLLARTRAGYTVRPSVTVRSIPSTRRRSPASP